MPTFVLLADDIVRHVNFAEALLWIAVGVGFLLSLTRPGRRGAKAVASVNFIVFGTSDFVEMSTGAWWTPWWLCAWKITCVCAMVGQLVLYLRARRGERSAEDASAC